MRGDWTNARKIDVQYWSSQKAVSTPVSVPGIVINYKPCYKKTGQSDRWSEVEYITIDKCVAIVALPVLLVVKNETFIWFTVKFSNDVFCY